jgi:hypothetical protein
MIMGYLATTGVSIAGKYLMPHYAQLSPQLVGNYRDYFRGGVMDMVSSVIQCWEILEQRIFNFTNSTQFCKFIDLNGTYPALIKPLKTFLGPKIKIRSERYDQEHKMTWMKSLISVVNELASNVISLVWDFFKSDPCKGYMYTRVVRISSDSLYAQLGKAVVVGDFNGDGQKEIGTVITFTLSNFRTILF